jgi:hypothetical protein
MSGLPYKNLSTKIQKGLNKMKINKVQLEAAAKFVANNNRTLRSKLNLSHDEFEKYLHRRMLDTVCNLLEKNQEDAMATHMSTAGFTVVLTDPDFVEVLVCPDLGQEPVCVDLSDLVSDDIKSAAQNLAKRIAGKEGRQLVVNSALSAAVSTRKKPYHLKIKLWRSWANCKGNM